MAITCLLSWRGLANIVIQYPIRYYCTYLCSIRRSSIAAVWALGVARRRFFGMFALQMTLQGGQTGQHLKAEIAHIWGRMQTCG